MYKNIKSLNRCCLMDARSYVFNIFNMLSERSHLKEVAGTVVHIRNKVCKFGCMLCRKLSSSLQLMLVACTLFVL